MVDHHLGPARFCKITGRKGTKDKVRRGRNKHDATLTNIRILTFLVDIVRGGKDVVHRKPDSGLGCLPHRWFPVRFAPPIPLWSEDKPERRTVDANDEVSTSVRSNMRGSGQFLKDRVGVASDEEKKATISSRPFRPGFGHLRTGSMVPFGRSRSFLHDLFIYCEDQNAKICEYRIALIIIYLAD